MADELVKMSDQFGGLPMDSLIGGPLRAASDAQISLAKSVQDFIQTIGFDNNQNTRMVSFKYVRQEQNPATGAVTPVTSEIDVPLISIVQIPNLLIDTVDIIFDMEVKSSFSEKSSTDAQAGLEASASVGYGVFSANVKISGSVATHKENTRSSDNSAKYHVEVHAKQAGTPEGLSRVLDMLNQAIAPKAAQPTPPPQPQPQPTT